MIPSMILGSFLGYSPIFPAVSYYGALSNAISNSKVDPSIVFCLTYLIPFTVLNYDLSDPLVLKSRSSSVNWSFSDYFSQM